MKYHFCILFTFTIPTLSAQIYLDHHTRHRFAQLNLGLDLQFNTQDTTHYFDAEDQIQELNLPTLFTPRFLIGGTHFWGHADFYISIPWYVPTFSEANQQIQFSSSVETVFKYYPLPIRQKGIRPFIGFSIAPFQYRQDNKNFTYGSGPELTHTSLPLLTGLTYHHHNQLLEARLMWNYANKQEYYIDCITEVDVGTPPLYIDISYRFILETTISAEADWESGQTAMTTTTLAQQGKLNGFYIGAGMSSAFWTGKSSYNEAVRPYISPYPISLMPDFTLGYYFHKPDINMDLAYRGYSTSTDTYGAVQDLKRRSLGLEATKFLFDYHGFVPFVGPVISYEKLFFTEHFEDQLTYDLSDEKIAYGLTFGWDIRPNRLQSFIIRTNLRWYPDLDLKVDDDTSISFNAIEFNFIQLVVYLNRIL